MGLINLVTNLPNFYYYQAKGYEGGLGNFTAKSKPYGHDRPDNGSSNEPYIKKEIPSGRIYGGRDFLLRDGVLTAGVIVDDVSRITQFLFDTKSPSGLLFTTKQILLERQNPKTNYSRRIYNPLSTILQTGVVALGGHLNKQGFLPFERSYYTGGRDGYFNTTQDNNTLTYTPVNRLYGLYTTKILQEPSLSIESNIIYSIDTLNPQVLISYPGGPNAGLFGKTKIRLQNDSNTSGLYVYPQGDRTEILPGDSFRLKKGTLYYKFQEAGYISDKFGVSYTWANNFTLEQIGNIAANVTNGSLTNTFNKDKAYKQNIATNGYLYSTQTYEQLLNSGDEYGQAKGIHGGFYDFRSEVEGQASYNGNYANTNREARYRTSITTYNGNVVNGKRVLNPNLAISPDQTEEGVLGEDIIDFNVTYLANEGSNVLLDFKAYVSDLSDNFTGEWDAFKYVGRGENFYKYKGYTREISIKFSVVALSRADMVYNYRKLNQLVGLAAPDYSSLGFMRGNFARVTLGTYLTGVPGIIKSVGLDVDMNAGWDINKDYETAMPIEKGNDLYVGQLPKLINVNMTFTPVHSFVPKIGQAFIGVGGIHNETEYNKTPILNYNNEDGTTYTYKENSIYGVGLPKESPLLYSNYAKKHT
jgi:hypothetical protein